MNEKQKTTKEFRWGPSNIGTNFLICSLNVKVEIWDTKTFHKNKIKQMGYSAGSSRALQHFLQLRRRHMSQLLTLHSIKTNFVFSSWEHLEVWGKGLGFKKHDNSRFHSHLFTTTLILWCLVTIITGRNLVSPYKQELGRKIKNSQSEKQAIARLCASVRERERGKEVHKERKKYMSITK